MKRISIFALFCLLLLPAIAQENYRKIYLWDVTESMVDYKLDEIVPNYIKKHINSQNKENTEIIIVPFQDSVLTRYIIKESVATSDAKQRICKKINEIGPKCMRHTKHWRTNIIDPIKFATEHYMKTDRNNKMYLLTDGYDEYHGNSAVVEYLKTWDKTRDKDDDLLVYIMTTSKAEIPLPPGMTHVVKKDTTILHLEEIQIEPSYDLVQINNKGNDTLTIEFKTTKRLPEGVKILARSAESAPIAINENVEIVKNEIKLHLKYKYAELKERLPEESYMELYLTVLNNEYLEKQYNTNITVFPSTLKLKLVNKKYRVLTVSLLD